MELLDLVFSDLFVGQSAETSWFKSLPDAREVQSLPPTLYTELGQLRSALLEQSRDRSFRIEWGTAGREWLRVKPIVTAYVDPLYVCRRFVGRPRPISDLGVPPQVCDRLLAEPLRGGLILVLGQMAAGKTTLASSLIVEYIGRHGGVAMTVEAPIEIDMEGRHGRGIVYQTEVETDDAMGMALPGVLRSAANLVFVGEVKTDSAAREVLMLSTSGHPVVTTFHAPDIPTGLMRFARAAGDQYDALADALTAVLHLTLRHPAAGACATVSMGLPGRPSPPARHLTVVPLFVAGETRDQVRSAIRAGQFHQLGSEIDRQRRVILSGGAL